MSNDQSKQNWGSLILSERHVNGMKGDTTKGPGDKNFCADCVNLAPIWTDWWLCTQIEVSGHQSQPHTNWALRVYMIICDFLFLFSPSCHQASSPYLIQQVYISVQKKCSFSWKKKWIKWLLSYNFTTKSVS